MNRSEELKRSNFEKLKKLCDENGFELITESPDENDKFFVVKKKDIWEGVEFCKVAKIHKVYRIDADKIYFANNRTETWALKEKCTPSTEQAYIEQLKKEAFERFGEIKDGDRFKFNYIEQTCQIGFTDFDYYKHIDRLQAFGAIIYQQGKWAERVKERVKVKCSGSAYESDDNCEISIYFELSRNHEILNKKLSNVSEFLASQLEKYLNNEIS